MVLLEVLVGELLAVDGLSASALFDVLVSASCPRSLNDDTHVAAGEVTALEHKVRDNTVELGASVAKALLAGAQGAEVLNGLGDDVVVQVEVDAAALLCGRSTSASM